MVVVELGFASTRNCQAIVLVENTHWHCDSHGVCIVGASELESTSKVVVCRSCFDSDLYLIGAEESAMVRACLDFNLKELFVSRDNWTCHPK